MTSTDGRCVAMITWMPAARAICARRCTAASRVVVHKKVAKKFTSLLVERTKQLKLGNGLNDKTDVGPVINQESVDKILSYIEIGKNEGRLLTGGGQHERAGEGWFIPPTVFGDVDPQARVSQEEVFGPVLACIKAGDWQAGLAIANNTIYGLTGAFYSSNRARIEQAKRDFHVGNLYINRKCTGALVDVHPFGGFNMSGTDSKAGGRDYLLLFLQAKSGAEKI